MEVASTAFITASRLRLDHQPQYSIKFQVSKTHLLGQSSGQDRQRCLRLDGLRPLYLTFAVYIYHYLPLPSKGHHCACDRSQEVLVMASRLSIMDIPDALIHKVVRCQMSTCNRSTPAQNRLKLSGRGSVINERWIP